MLILKEIIAKTLKLVIKLGNQCDESIRSYYFQLLACIGLYDISSEDARLLFNLAFPPPNSNKVFFEVFLVFISLRKKNFKCRCCLSLGALQNEKCLFVCLIWMDPQDICKLN